MCSSGGGGMKMWLFDSNISIRCEHSINLSIMFQEVFTYETW